MNKKNIFLISLVILVLAGLVLADEFFTSLGPMYSPAKDNTYTNANSYLFSVAYGGNSSQNISFYTVIAGAWTLLCTDNSVNVTDGTANCTADISAATFDAKTISINVTSFNSSLVQNLSAIFVFNFTIDRTAPNITNLTLDGLAANNLNTTSATHSINYSVHDNIGYSQNICNLSIYNSALVVIATYENRTVLGIDGANTTIKFNNSFSLGATNGVYLWNLTCADNATNSNRNGTYTITFDNVVPIDAALTRDFRGDLGFGVLSVADEFFSTSSGNNLINISLNLTDTTIGLKNVTFNFSSVCSNVGSLIVNSSENGFWWANCTVNVTGNFNSRNITMTACDWLGNCNTTLWRTVTIYNFTKPLNNSGMRFLDGTTNLATETNLSVVNYAIDAEVNMTIYGGSGWNRVRYYFPSLDMSAASIGAQLSNISSCINITFKDRHSYGNNRIELNSTCLTSFNTNATLTLYNLPLTSVNTSFLVNDSGNMAGTSITYATNGDGTGNLTFTVNHFSGYNVNDTSGPKITITSPADSSIKETFYFHAVLNGTGTEINWSTINLTITNSTGSVFTFYNATLNCSFQSGTNKENTVCINNSIIASESLSRDGVYNFTLVVADFGGANGNTRAVNGTNITVDTTGPSTPTFSCLPASVDVGATVTCTCSGSTDTYSAVTYDSYSEHPTTATAGTFTETCRALDSVGNYATATSSYTVASSSGGSGSTGSAGGTSVGTVNTFEQKTWTSINVGETATISTKNGEIGVTEVSFKVDKTAWGAWAKIQKQDSLPSGTKAFSNKVYKYVEVTKGLALKDEIIKDAVIKFKVKKTWLVDNKLEKGSVVLYRYNADKWNELLTTVGQDDGTYVHYSASTPGFSYFVIGEKKGVTAPVAEKKVGEAPTTGSSEEVTAPVEEEAAGEEIQKAGWAWVAWLILAIVIVVVIIGFFMKKKKKR